MAPHPPPCYANEVLWGNTCYPRIDTFRIEKVGANYKFILEEVPGDLLHGLADKAGDQANLHVKKAGPGFEVTITSIPHGDATDLLKQLRPDDPNLQLPD
ncbi:hypothetical protein JJE66_26470 [Bradyrhizobium diazoefficiens]|uniref:hypothetical protein n=1 Tax=Bradyrhizobium diazoefficiens TaxID=1355477 RepID=UPI00190BBAE6|nr:hypothetical protein [Bradyrhizobium diazoefficiens]MBK3664759.1 hypothetical protein [Bradyrhizobium diazoefficiens]